MSTTHSAEPGPASTDALIESAFDVTGVTAIDRQIANVRERIRATSPHFARLLPSYWDEIDHLLDLRLWLTGGARA